MKWELRDPDTAIEECSEPPAVEGKILCSQCLLDAVLGREGSQDCLLPLQALL